MSHPKTSIFMVHWKTSSFGNLHIDQVKFLKMRKSRVSNQKETHETIWSLHSDNKRVWFCPKEMVNVLAKVRNLYNDQKKPPLVAWPFIQTVQFSIQSSKIKKKTVRKSTRLQFSTHIVLKIALLNKTCLQTTLPLPHWPRNHSQKNMQKLGETKKPKKPRENQKKQKKQKKTIVRGSWWSTPTSWRV